MKALVIAGSGQALEQACATAVNAGLSFDRIELRTADRFNFDLEPLCDQYRPADTAVFVALDGRGVNLARHKLVAEVRLKGYAPQNIVAPDASLDPDVCLMGNVYVGQGCHLLAGSSLGTGCWVDRAVIVERDSRLGACVTLGAGVVVGRASEIGTGTSLGTGSSTLANSRIGRHCEWLLPGVLPEVLLDRSFFDSLMPEGARILTH